LITTPACCAHVPVAEPAAIAWISLPWSSRGSAGRLSLAESIYRARKGPDASSARKACEAKDSARSAVGSVLAPSIDQEDRFMSTRASRGAALAVALTIVGCGGDGGNSTPTSPSPSTGGGGGGTAATVTVNITASSGPQSFDPNPAGMATTGTIAWVNRDPAVHRIVANDGSFDTGDIAPGATSRAIAAPAAGANYHCSIHPTMVGAIGASQGQPPPPCTGPYC
jgi:plastocyanin